MPWWMRNLPLFSPADEGGDGSGSGSQGVSGAHPAAGSGDDDGEKGGDGGDGGEKAGATGSEKKGDSSTGGDGQGEEGLLADHAKKQGKEGGENGEGEADPDKETKQEGKPEGLPDQFWDAERGEVRQDALVKAWKDTRDELRKAKESSGTGKAPEKAEDYKLENPEGINRPITDDDPGRKIFAEVAHKHGLTQEQAQGVFGEFLSEMQEAGAIPAPMDIEAEKQKLGKHADAIMSSVYNWGNQLKEQGVIGDDGFEELIILGSTADGLKALNQIRQHYTGERGIPTDTDAVEGLPSKEELYAMVGDERYGTDPAYTAKVTKQFQQVFGSAPSGSSQPGLGVPKPQQFAFPQRSGNTKQ